MFTNCDELDYMAFSSTRHCSTLTMRLSDKKKRSTSRCAERRTRVVLLHN